jgi:hypothetical protein
LLLTVSCLKAFVVGCLLFFRTKYDSGKKWVPRYRSLHYHRLWLWCSIWWIYRARPSLYSSSVPIILFICWLFLDKLCHTLLGRLDYSLLKLYFVTIQDLQENQTMNILKNSIEKLSSMSGQALVFVDRDFPLKVSKRYVLIIFSWQWCIAYICSMPWCVTYIYNLYFSPMSTDLNLLVYHFLQTTIITLIQKLSSTINITVNQFFLALQLVYML